MAALEELETLLQSLQALKAPGITKPKIEAINAKCVENVQFDAAIVQKIVQQFKNSPATHKLGVLYVVDSVTRQWTEKAKLAGQAISKNAAPGTFASGVQKVTDALPSLMTDIIQSAPESHREKISKLVDIWERGLTFPLAMLVGFKKQLSQPQKNTNTPPGSPPNGHNSGYLSSGQTNQQPVAPQLPIAPPQDTGALLAALAGFGQQQQQQQQQIPQPSAMPVAPPALPFLQNMVPPPPPPPGYAQPPLPAATGPPVMPPSAASVSDLAGQILQAITTGSIAPEQGLQVLNALAAAQNGGATLPIPPQLPVVSQAQPGAQNGTQQHQYEQDSSRFRDRSRSPDYRGGGSGSGRRRSPNRRTPPNRRDSPTYAAYDPNAGAEGNSVNRPERGERGRGRNKNRKGTNDRNEYRQRTPPGQRRQPSPAGKGPQNSGQPKYLEWDHSLPRDNIKVLSRTLFVGGAAGTEGEIRSIFSRFGRVQTCIVNQDKRHAFVKMLTRPDAVAAKEGMDSAQDPIALAKARQTRWGVGFGPRDCSDYATGISVIPIARLTDADRKWALTAENGGTGGRPLEGGMIIEEPDIEIGAGVSSKAISKRVPTDSGRGGRGGGFGGRGGAFRKHDRPPVNDARHISPRPEQAVAVPPAVPGFGFQLPGF